MDVRSKDWRSHWIFPLGVILFTFLFGRIAFVGTFNGSIRPTPSQWFMFVLTVGAVLCTYLKSSKRKMIKTVANIADFVVVLIIFACVLWTNPSAWDFSTLEKTCVATTIAAVCYFLASGKIFFPDMIVQVAMVAAFVPKYAELWGQTTHNDSGVFWVLALAQALCALPATTVGLERKWEKREDWIPFIYVARGTTLVLATIVLLLAVNVGVWSAGP